MDYYIGQKHQSRGCPTMKASIKSWPKQPFAAQMDMKISPKAYLITSSRVNKYFPKVGTQIWKTGLNYLGASSDRLPPFKALSIHTRDHM